MSDKIFHYPGEKISIRYEVKRCIHAAECARNLPGVFDPQRKPWVDPDAAVADTIAAVVERCPTGALRRRVAMNLIIPTFIVAGGRS